MKLIKEETLSDGYIRETYDNGAVVTHAPSPEPVESSEVEIEPEAEPDVQAELLLNQMDIIAKQKEQDEVLAEILLSTVEGGSANV